MIKCVDFDLLTIILLFLIYIPVFIILRWKMKKSNSYLIVFTVLFVYICGVLKYTQFPIIISNEMEYDIMKNINYVPILTLSTSDIRTSLLNIVLSVPFGFLISFLKKQNVKRTLWYGILFGVITEGIQFVVGRFIGCNMRVIDVNDVIFNFVGVCIGYISFLVCRTVFEKIIKIFSIESNEFLNFCFFDK